MKMKENVLAQINLGNKEIFVDFKFYWVKVILCLLT